MLLLESNYILSLEYYKIANLKGLAIFTYSKRLVQYNVLLSNQKIQLCIPDAYILRSGRSVDHQALA